MAVAHVLPRLWDAPRLMRFLAGLALMALAFAAHAGLTVPAAPTAVETAVTSDTVITSDTVVTTAVDVPAAPVVSAPVVSAPAASAPVASTPGAEQAVVTRAGVDLPADAAAEPAPATGTDAPAGRPGSAWGSRAPPRR